MDAKTFLSGAYCLELQIRSKMEQIEALRALATRVTGSIGPEPVSHTPNNTAMEDTVLKILEAEEELNRKIDALVERKLEIARVIDRVADVKLRLILEERYLLFKSWEEIALDVGLTVRWLQVKHDRAIEAVEEVMGETEE